MATPLRDAPLEDIGSGDQMNEPDGPCPSRRRSRYERLSAETCHDAILARRLSRADPRGERVQPGPAIVVVQRLPDAIFAMFAAGWKSSASAEAHGRSPMRLITVDLPEPDTPINTMVTVGVSESTVEPYGSGRRTHRDTSVTERRSIVLAQCNRLHRRSTSATECDKCVPVVGVACLLRCKMDPEC